MWGPDGDDRSVDNLFGHYGEEAVSYLCAKWRLDRGRWRSGDVPPCPMSLTELADFARAPSEQVRAFDDQLIRTLASDSTISGRADLNFFLWPIQTAPALWQRSWGRTYDGDGRLLRKL